MDDAWNMTYREMCLLMEVRAKVRTVQVGNSSLYDEDRLAGLTEHLRTIGVEL